MPGPWGTRSFPIVKIYTRTGDDGDTGLFGGARVSKSDPRVAAYGDIDELNAVIGLVLAVDPLHWERETLVAIQRDLFGIGAQLASPNPAKVLKSLAKAEIPDERIAALEAEIDRADAELDPLKAFVLPGGSIKAAHLHHARTVCRRAERLVVGLDDVPEVVVKYLNRLSDLLFTLARLANVKASVQEEEW